jgi:hypothetical protein
VAVRLKSAGAVVAYRLLPISVDPCRGNQNSVMCCSFSIAPGHEIVGDVERCWSGSQVVWLFGPCLMPLITTGLLVPTRPNSNLWAVDSVAVD